ncbi:hypothetical protein BB561_005804 [Smittium simulii]|uniref:Ras GEF n=1 Tax=Smittium simulii TaxID=133385 RepID=A0A2T9Y891_9FUNG|nr:hypothetical protein BB561_005804 [Smittium simulii]
MNSPSNDHKVDSQGTSFLKKIPRISLTFKKNSVQNKPSFQLSKKISSSFESFKRSFKSPTKGSSASVDTTSINQNTIPSIKTHISTADSKNISPDFIIPSLEKFTLTRQNSKVEPISEYDTTRNSFQNVTYTFPYFDSLSKAKRPQDENNTETIKIIRHESDYIDLPHSWRVKYSLSAKKYYYNIITNFSSFEIDDVYKEEDAAAINDSLMQVIERMHSNADDISKKSFIRAYQRQIINSGCDLLLTASIAASVWPPPDSSIGLLENAKSLLALVHQFLIESEDCQLQGFQTNSNSPSLQISNKKSSFQLQHQKDDSNENAETSNPNYTNLGINTSGLNFFYILKNCKSLDFFHINAKKYIHPLSGNRLSTEQEAAKQRLKRYLSTLQNDQKVTNVAKRSESFSNIHSASMQRVELMDNTLSSKENQHFEDIMSLILLTFAKVENECRNLAKTFLIFESAVKKFAKALLEISNETQENKSHSEMQAIKPEFIRHSDIDSISRLADCTKLISNKCYPVIIGISALLKEVDIIEQICNFCGVNDDLVSFTEALSIKSKGSTDFQPRPSISRMDSNSSRQSQNFTVKIQIKDFKKAKKNVIDGSINLITTTQELAFMLPQIVYYDQFVKKNSEAANNSMNNLIDYNYGIREIDKNHSVFFTTISTSQQTNGYHLDKTIQVNNGNSPTSHNINGKTSKNKFEITNPITNSTNSQTIDELYGLRNTDQVFKNLTLPIKKNIRDTPNESDLYLKEYKNTLTTMATNLKQMVELINTLDSWCLNLMTLSKLELNDCNQKIINVFYQYLISGRFLPAQSLNRKKNTGLNHIFKPSEDKIKSIPIVPNYIEAIKLEPNVPQPNKPSDATTSSRTFKKFSIGNSLASINSKKQKPKKNYPTEPNDTFHRISRLSNTFKPLDENNQDSLKFFFSKYSLRKSVNSHSSNNSERSSVQSIFSQFNNNPPSQNYENSYVISSASTQPWYLQPEFLNDNAILFLDGSLKAATLSAMVERLTAHDVLDSRFVNSFMLTYHSFTTTPRLFGLLFDRYTISPPPGLRQNEIQFWKERKLDTVRLRVFNILKLWLREHFYPLIGGDIEALEMLKVFACAVMADSQPTLAEKLVKMIESHKAYLNVIDKKRKSEQSVLSGNTLKRMSSNSWLKMINNHQNENHLDKTLFKSLSLGRLSIRKFAGNNLSSPPTPILPKVKLTSNTIIEKIDPIELARQITIIDHNLLTLVRPIEFLKKAWSVSLVDPKAVNGLTVEVATNLRSISVFSTKITHYITSKILEEQVIENRVSILSYFISLAEQLWTLNNYNSLVSVIGAIQSTPIQRLTKTWKILPAKSLNAFESIKSIMKSSRNYSTYREAIQKSSPPSIPFIGLSLTDLTFIEDGNPDYYDDSKDMINFSKYIQTADIIRQIQEFQDVPYSFIQVNEIISYIFNGLKSSLSQASYSENLIDMFLKMSHAIEPNN